MKRKERPANTTMDSVRLSYTPRHDATPEAELDALAAVYKFVLFDLQAMKGDAHDLLSNPTPKMMKNGPRTTEQENT